MLSKNQKLGLLLIILTSALFVFFANEFAVADKTPIAISLKDDMPDKMIKGQTYEVSVDWANNDKKTYDGSFLFSAVGNQPITSSSDIKITLKGLEIKPNILGSSLQFQLPKQTFASTKSGTIHVEIQNNNLGTYSWTISVIKV